MNNSNLFRLRVREKLSVEDLAKILDIPADSIRAWENDEKEPTSAELKKLAVFYNVSVDYLIGVKTEENVDVKPVKKEEKSKNSARSAIFSKWTYLAIPAMIALLFIFMIPACYSSGYGSVGLWTVMFAESMQAAGIFFVIFNVIFLLYFAALLLLNKKNLAKMNIVNLCMLAVVFIVDTALGIYTLVRVNAGFNTFFGIFSMILWFAVAVYALVLEIIYIVKINRKSDVSENSENENKSIKSKEENKVAEKNVNSTSKIRRSAYYYIVSMISWVVYIVTAITSGNGEFSNLSLFAAVCLIPIVACFVLNLTMKNKRKVLLISFILDLVSVCLSAAAIWPTYNKLGYHANQYLFIPISTFIAIGLAVIMFVINLVKFVKINNEYKIVLKNGVKTEQVKAENTLQDVDFVFCTNCGNKVQKDQKFCGKCGNKM